METEVEIDVGQENFPSSKVEPFILVFLLQDKYLQVEVEASPAIMASLTSMEQDVPSLQVCDVRQSVKECQMPQSVIQFHKYQHLRGCDEQHEVLQLVTHKVS